MKATLLLLLLLLLFFRATILYSQYCIDAMPPGVPLPPANSKAYWNWKGDDPTKFDGTGNYSFRKPVIEVAGGVQLVSALVRVLTNHS